MAVWTPILPAKQLVLNESNQKQLWDLMWGGADFEAHAPSIIPCCLPAPEKTLES